MNLQWLTFGISLSVLLKFFIDHRFGASSYGSIGSYTSFANKRYAEEGYSRRIGPRLYRFGYTLKWVGVLLLPVGGWPTTIGAAMIIWWFFWIEIQYDYKHHVIFLGLCCGITMLASPSGLFFPQAIEEQDVVLIRYAALLLLTQMYLSSAFIKCLSPSFVSGQVLSNLFRYLAIEQNRFAFRETYIPKRLANALVTENVRYLRFFKICSLATIFFEFLIPILLWFPSMWAFAFTLGLIMHLCFQVIYPVRLAPFLVSSLTLYFVVPR